MKNTHFNQLRENDVVVYKRNGSNFTGRYGIIINHDSSLTHPYLVKFPEIGNMYCNDYELEQANNQVANMFKINLSEMQS